MKTDTLDGKDVYEIELDDWVFELHITEDFDSVIVHKAYIIFEFDGKIKKALCEAEMLEMLNDDKWNAKIIEQIKEG